MRKIDNVFSGSEAIQMKLRLKARVNSSDARTIRHALGQLPAKGSVRKTDDDPIVEAEVDGRG
jgi:hypothetical protein